MVENELKSKKNDFEEKCNKNYVSLGYQSEDEFRIVAETLTRMGELDPETNTLTPQVWLVKKRGITYLVHYKHILDQPLDDGDYAIINTIAEYLKSWGLVTFVRNFYFLRKYGVSANFRAIARKDIDNYTRIALASNPQIKFFLDNIFDRPIDSQPEINYNKV
jgi:hypothetical protein